MAFAKQETVIERLERETVTDLDKRRKHNMRELFRQWQLTRRDMRRAIWQVYTDLFPSSDWDFATAQRSGALFRIERATREAIDRLKSNSAVYVTNAVNDLYKESVLRHAWMLDQVTPPGYKVRLPIQKPLIEAGRVKYYKGDDAMARWKMRWDGWLDAYHNSLNHNIRLGAINDSAVSDVVDEVDATKAGSPSMDIWGALQRVFLNISQVAIAKGQSDVSGMNEGVKKIWQTRYNQRVCDICDENAGLSEEEASDEIPAHPNCFCYWRLVPNEWAKLLASGDLNDRETAKRLDAMGIPSALAIMNEDGNLVAHAIINFMDWTENTFQGRAA